MPNLDLCLSTFHILGGELGDPTTGSESIEDISRAELECRWRASLRELTAMAPPEKIFLVLVSEAYEIDPPMKESKNGRGKLPLPTWAQGCRPLPLDGGYLPVHDVLKAALNTNFKGRLSVEVFDSTERPNIDLEAFARSAKEMLEKLLLFS